LEPRGGSTIEELRNLRPSSGLLRRFYCLDGYTEAENNGWDKDYNFGSKDKVMRAGRLPSAHTADFISTDQMEDLAAVIKIIALVPVGL